MKNENISSKNLDDYFALARDMQPVTGVEEMERRIVNAKMGSKSFFHTSKFKIAMSTSIIIIAAYIGSMFLMNSPIVEKTIIKNDENQILLEKKNSFNPNHKMDKGILVFNTKHENRRAERLDSSKPENNYQIDTSGSHKLSDLPDARPLELDLKHLEKLGFETGKNGQGIIYKTGIDGLGTMYYSNDASGSTLKINSKGFILNKIRDYYPVFISDGTSKEPEDIDYILRKENKFKSHDTSFFWHLVPVIIKQSEYGNFEGFKDITFWFKVTPSFSEVIKDVTTGASVVLMEKQKKTTDEEGLKRKHIEHELRKLYLEQKSSQPLELDKEQLQRLGFTILDFGMIYSCILKLSEMDITDDSLEKHHERIILNGNGSFEFSTLLDGGYHLTIDGKSNKQEGSIQDFYPVFISDRNGVQTIKYRFGNFESGEKWTEAYFLSEIRKLVPILVKKDMLGPAYKKDLIFWFNVTPSFLTALPDSISKEMGNEYNSLERLSKEISKSMKGLKQNAKTDISSNDTPTTTQCKYFDVCQLPLEKELKVNIYPNPAQLLLNVDFELLANTTATLYMCDLGGKIVKSTDQTYSGSQHVQIQTGDLKSGIYLVILKMSNGSVLTNKVVIASKD